MLDILGSSNPNRKKYAFVWNNDEKTEAVILNKFTNEILLIKGSEGTHSAKVIDTLRKEHLDAMVIPKGSRIVMTSSGVVMEDGTPVNEAMK